MRCRRCGAPKCTKHFDIRLCIEKRKRRSVWLCDQCDLVLQLMVADFVGIPFARKDGDDHEDRY